MAESSHENVKAKVQAVREVVPGKSNNEVVMVLQYYDYNVEQAIQAYIEDGAKEALQEWNFTGSKPNKKRKNKKKGNREKVSEKSGPSTLLLVGEEVALGDVERADLPNRDIDQAIRESEIEPSDNSAHSQQSVFVHASTHTTPSAAVVGNGAAAAGNGAAVAGNGAAVAGNGAAVAGNGAAVAAQPLPQRQRPNKGRSHRVESHQQKTEPHEKTDIMVSSRSDLEDGVHRKPHLGLEKAIKDLHRQTTSFERLRHVLDHEIDTSVKTLKEVFEELRQGLTKREDKLLEEMSILKREASEILEMRQSKASDLKRRMERSNKLRNTEVSELQAEIKHFVGERRHDENVGRTTRFLYDSDRMMEEINKFGEVVHVKSMYTPCSTLILTGDRSSPEDELSSTSSLPPTTQLSESSYRESNQGLSLPHDQSGSLVSRGYSSSTQGPRGRVRGRGGRGGPRGNGSYINERS